MRLVIVIDILSIPVLEFVYLFSSKTLGFCFYLTIFPAVVTTRKETESPKDTRAKSAREEEGEVAMKNSYRK